MPRELKIDRAVYLVDDDLRNYRFLRSNPDWADLDPAENEANKQQLDGYVRVLRSGRTRVYTRPRRR